tara:strand:+ start:263 stop:2389 length:2127 start_codon:yes stop_codon:yes gene_type:complete
MDKVSSNLNLDSFEKPMVFLVRASLLLVLLIPLIVTTNPLPEAMHTFYPYIVGKALFSRLMILIAIALWLILIINRTDYRPKKSWILSVFTIFLFGSLIASILGVGPTRSFWSNYERMQGMIDLAHWFAFVVICVSVFRDISSIRTLLKVNVLVSVLVALLGIAQKYGVGIPGFSYLGMDGLLRVDSTLGNPTFMGAYMMVSILIAAGVAAQALRNLPPLAEWTKDNLGNNRTRNIIIAPLPWIFVIGINFWVMMMSGARGALFGLAAGLILCLIVYLIKANNRHLRLFAAISLSCMLAISLLFVFGKNTSFIDRMAQSNRMVAMLSIIGSDEDSYSIRRELIDIGLQSFVQRPITGWGPENFYVAYDKNVTADAFSQMAATVDQPHNKVIEELATKGIVGFLPYAAIWVLIGLSYIRYLWRNSNPHWDLVVFLAGASAGYFVQNLFLFDTASTSLQFYLLLCVPILLEKSCVQNDKSYINNNLGISLFDRITSIFTLRLKSFRTIALSLKGIWKMPEFHIPVVIALFILIYIFVIHFPFVGSQHTRKAIYHPLPAIERMYQYDLAINKSPVMSGYPRIFLFMFLSDGWSTFNEDERTAAIYLAKKHFADGIKLEPQNWRIYLGACRLYQSASFEHPDLLGLCDEYLDEVDKIAPNRIETYEARTRQYLIKGNISAAQSTLNEYLNMNPQSRHLLEPLIGIAFQGEGE